MILAPDVALRTLSNAQSLRGLIRHNVLPIPSQPTLKLSCFQHLEGLSGFSVVSLCSATLKKLGAAPLGFLESHTFFCSDSLRGLCNLESQIFSRCVVAWITWKRWLEFQKSLGLLNNSFLCTFDEFLKSLFFVPPIEVLVSWVISWGSSVCLSVG